MKETAKVYLASLVNLLSKFDSKWLQQVPPSQLNKLIKDSPSNGLQKIIKLFAVPFSDSITISKISWSFKRIEKTDHIHIIIYEQ